MAEEVTASEVPRVVLIEDDPLVCLGQEMLLKDWGYRVVVGTSRDTIHQALQAAPHDVAAIIADYNVGGPETGAELARTVAAAANRPIPTLIMSASMGRSSGQTAQLHGFAFLPKPVDPEELRTWLATVTAE